MAPAVRDDDAQQVNIYLIPAKLKLTVFTDMCVAPFSAPCCA